MTTELDPQKLIFRPGSRGARWTYASGVIAISAFAATIVLVVIAVAEGPAWALVVTALAFVWAIGAPAWFWCEYFFVYRRDGLPGTFELYKHGHQVSVAIWAGLALSLGALASSDHFKERKNSESAAATTAKHEATPQPSSPPASK